MEEENQVFGKNAEAVDNNINLESEDFKFYRQNKEEAKKNIDSSSKELTDFIDSLIQDIPDPSEDEVAEGVKKILEKTHSEETKDKSSKSNKIKKATFKVLFIAALLSMISFSCLYVVGSSHNISIENGFVTFAKDTIKIVFFGEDKEEYITIDVLLTDLELHGYDDILFPQEFVNNSDEYRVSVPEYCDEELYKQVSFDICNEISIYTLSLSKYDATQKTMNFVEVNHVKTININGIFVYVFDYGNESYSVQFTKENCQYNMYAYAPYSEIVKIVNSIE